MSSINNDLKPETKGMYNIIHENHSKKNGQVILVSHFGEFSQDLVNSLSEGIEETMRAAGAKKSLIKRMFSTLIEGLQNLRIHGAKDGNYKQLGHLIISRIDDVYNISFGNLILTKDIDKLKSQLDKLNQMAPDEIKSYYMEVLSNGIMSELGGAGLGFITIAMKSKSKLDFSFKPLNDELNYFVLNISLSQS